MKAVEQVDLVANVLDIWQDKSVTLRERKPGPPERVDGMTVGVAHLVPGGSPHDGEMHPNGDEILYVVSGRLLLQHDSGNEPLELTSGQACIVRQDEWHKVECLEKTSLIHITPGPDGEARFLAED
ncbi:MAG: cupin domain-containing protein [Pseudomonadaceae bacterium]|nr:cupin domain-containing protein [Pseudomonadaceae bacterium]